MGQSFEPFDSFRHNRDHSSGSDRREPHAINDLLDAMDRVFNDEKALLPEPEVDSTPTQPSTHPLIELISRLCRMHEEMSDSPHRDALSQFLTNLESATWRLIEQTERLSMAAGTSIEVEMDHDELHEFMLNPDLDKWPNQRAVDTDLDLTSRAVRSRLRSDG